MDDVWVPFRIVHSVDSYSVTGNKDPIGLVPPLNFELGAAMFCGVNVSPVSGPENTWITLGPNIEPTRENICISIICYVYSAQWCWDVLRFTRAVIRGELAGKCHLRDSTQIVESGEKDLVPHLGRLFT